MIKGGPRVVTDGLVLCLDAHDAKSYAGEPTTNLLQYPESINSGPIQESWSGTITQNAVTAPDGTLTATKIEATSGYVYERLYINTSYNGVSFGVGDTITYSVWIKMLDGTQTTSNGPYIWNYNSPTYGIVDRDLSGLGPDWKLYKMTYTVQSHQTNFSISYSASNGGVTGTYAIWHPQLEVKSYNTSYVETSRSATNGWVDRSGNSNSGTLTNMIGTEVTHYRDGQVIMPVANSYLNFDGSNDNIDLTSHSSAFDFGTGNFSVEAWVNGAVNNNYRCIFWHHYNPGFTLITTYGQSPNGAPRFWLGGSVLNGTTSILDGTWHHVLVTRDGATVTIYIDGAQNVSNAGFSGKSATVSTAQAAIGQYNVTSSSYPFDGKIAVVRIYNKALTAAEVLSNYNATKGRFS